MSVSTRVRLTGRVVMYAEPKNFPGKRAYWVERTPGDAMRGHWEHSEGAVVLWNPEQYDTTPDGAPLSDEEQRTLTRRYERLPKGPRAEHYRRAYAAAHAYSDGAYYATNQLDKVFHLRTGPRDQSVYGATRRAHEVAQPTYEHLRMWLWDDHGVPYFIACEVAARVTRWLDTHPNYPPF